MKWVKHDTDANQDAKLQNVLLDYGLEGYGLYWYCIELIAGKVDKENITFELEHDARVIARNVGSTPDQIQTILLYFVNQGLFENIEGSITCLKLARRLDRSMTSNPQMREIISNLQYDDIPAKVLTASAEVLTTSAETLTPSAKPMQDKIRLDKNRIDKSKEENSTKKKKFSQPSVTQVGSYMVDLGVSIPYAQQESVSFVDYYTSNGWKVGRNSMKDWKATVRNWLKRGVNNNGGKQQSTGNGSSATERVKAAMRDRDQGA